MMSKEVPKQDELKKALYAFSFSLFLMAIGIIEFTHALIPRPTSIFGGFLIFILGLSFLMASLDFIKEFKLWQEE